MVYPTRARLAWPHGRLSVRWRRLGRRAASRPSHPAGPVTGAPRLALRPDTASAAGARRWVAESLAGLPGELVDTATLLTSEMVTNAVLHAGTDIEVAVHRGGTVVRIDVADHSPVVPVVKHFAPDAATGRGLVLLQAMAACWGVEAAPQGKVVWFELALAGCPRGAAPSTGAGNSAAPSTRAGDTAAGGSAPDPVVTGDVADGPAAGTSDRDEMPLVDVRLLGVPIDLLDRTTEQHDALFREFRLLVEVDPDEGHAVPGRLLALGDELTTQYGHFTVGTDAALFRARERGDATVDLDYRLPAGVGPAAVHYDALLDEADAYCQAGTELLTLAPPPASTALRRWILGEFARQTAAEARVAWPDSDWCREAGTISPPTMAPA
jgi:anti-sigma regulatory factor (Ser/Thr protein kinase)